MTLTVRNVAESVFGAYRLARFDPTGVLFLERTPEGALKSFFAAVIVLPAYVVLIAIRVWAQVDDTPLLQVLLVEGIAYVVTWTAFPVAMHAIAGAIDREKRFIDFLCAYNWSSVVQMAVYLPAVVLSESRLLPEGISEGLVIGVVMAMLAYQWFILRTTLDIGGLPAAGLVVLDLFLSAMITDFADSLL